MKFFISIFFIIIIPNVQALAACISAVQGSQRRFEANLYVCDSSMEWVVLGDGNTTGDTCTAAEIGKQKFALDNSIGRNGMIFCDGTNWLSLTTGISTDLAVCTQPGKQRYANDNMEYCPNALGTWQTMKTTLGPLFTICGAHGTQAPCDADLSCYWNAGVCSACNCKQ